MENFFIAIKPTRLSWAVSNEFHFPLGFSYLDHLCCHNMSSLSPVKSVQDKLKKKKKLYCFLCSSQAPCSLHPLSRLSTTITFHASDLLSWLSQTSLLDSEPVYPMVYTTAPPEYLKSTSSSTSKANLPATPHPTTTSAFLGSVWGTIIYLLILKPWKLSLTPFLNSTSIHEWTIVNFTLWIFFKYAFFFLALYS